MARNKKPILVAVGQHMIDINDVACISRIKDRKLYVVRLKSQPNMEYPIWVNNRDIGPLLAQFNIIMTDENEVGDTPNDPEDD